MRHSLLTALVAVVFTSACVTNPARRLTPNAEEILVREELDGRGDPKKPRDPQTAVFLRGEDPLDEQEFYEAIGDTESFEKVKSSRTAGTTFEGIGFGMMVVGIIAAVAGAAAYYLSSDSLGSPPPIPVPESARTPVFYGALGAVAVAGIGGTIFFGTQAQARGDKRIFDLAHARQRLETSLYGENGASPDDIKTLTFGAGNEGARICAGGSLTLAPLVALDARGRRMKVSDRADWFQFLTTPRPGLAQPVPDAPVISSPLGTDFKDVNGDVTLRVQVAQTGVGHQLSFGHEFGCSSAVGDTGSYGGSGPSGSSGRDGQYGSSSHGPGAGGPGGDGGDGGPGGPGPRIDAEVAWVTTEKYGRLALLVVNGDVRLFDPTRAQVRVVALGGEGGRGGSGGKGGYGGSAASSSCMPGGNGGSGGRGGRGGTGGSGGRVFIRASDPALLSAVVGDASGGRGGDGGSAGDGGGHGSRGSCRNGFASEGVRGPSGSSGPRGSQGPSGTVDTAVVPASELAGVAQVLAQNPTLTLDESAPVNVVPKKKRR